MIKGKSTINCEREWNIYIKKEKIIKITIVQKEIDKYIQN